MDSFDEQFDKGVELALERSRIASRKIAMEVFRGVIMMTPVDTGRARANWQASIGSPVSGTTEDSDKGGGATVFKAMDVARGWDINSGAAFLTNNLPYIQALEEGHSGQAPAGMVAVTVARFEATAREVGIRVKGGEQ